MTGTIHHYHDLKTDALNMTAYTESIA